VILAIVLAVVVVGIVALVKLDEWRFARRRQAPPVALRAPRSIDWHRSSGKVGR
jgi:hypothetical protein